MRHTPRPWSADVGAQGLAVYGGPDEHIICVLHRTPGAPAWDAEAEANARLIATAPAMLKAAQKLCQAYLDAPNHPNPYDWLYRFVDRLATAIRQATGEEQTP